MVVIITIQSGNLFARLLMKKVFLLFALLYPALVICVGESVESTRFIPEPTTPPDSSVKLGFYFGNIHSHTAFSDGSGTPDQAFQWARDSAGYDFYAITDHAELLTLDEWDLTGISADAHNADGQFVTLRGFEWSHNLFGHIDIFETTSYVSAYDVDHLDDLYVWIKENDALAQFNHPGREPLVFNNLTLDLDVFNNFFAIETGNKNAGNNSGFYLPYYYQALINGWRVAPTNNQDNHVLSTNSHRTVIIAPALTREDILDALRQRRFYSSDDPDLKLTFRYGNYHMGSTIVRTPGVFRFDVTVADNEPVEKIEFLNAEGTVLKTFVTPEQTGNVSTSFYVQVDAYGCFFVKVYENDINGDCPANTKQIAVSAPIWVYAINGKGQM